MNPVRAELLIQAPVTTVWTALAARTAGAPTTHSEALESLTIEVRERNAVRRTSFLLTPRGDSTLVAVTQEAVEDPGPMIARVLGAFTPGIGRRRAAASLAEELRALAADSTSA